MIRGVLLFVVVYFAASEGFGQQSPEVLWTFSTGAIEHAPAIGKDGTIYVATQDFFSSDNRFYALNPHGTLKWEFVKGTPFTGAPAIGQDGTIYVGGTHEFIAFSPHGTIQWRTKTVINAATAAVGQDGTVYFGTNERVFIALAPDGTERWRQGVDASIRGAPSIAADGTIYVGTDEPFGFAGRIYAFNPDGTVKWSAANGPIASAPALAADGTVYFSTTPGTLFAYNTNGTKKWAFKTGSYIFSSPVIGTDGTIYVGSFDHKLYAIQPDGTKKWEFLTSSFVRASPVIDSAGTVYVGSQQDGRLYGINPGGTKKWEFTTGGLVGGSANIGPNGEILIGTAAPANRLFALKGTSILANSPWPMHRHDSQNTGFASTELPTPDLLLAIGDASGTRSSEVVLPIGVSGFDRMIGLQFSIHWNVASLAFKGVEQFGLIGLGESNFGLHDASSGTLRVSWDDTGGTGVSLADGKVIFAIRFEITGPADSTEPVWIDSTPLPLEATILKDGKLIATPAGLRPGSVAIRASQFELRGTVHYYAGGRTVRDVQVQVNGVGGPTTTADGLFSVVLPAGEVATLTPHPPAESNPSQGVSTLDITLIRRHVLGIELLDSPYKMIAADVNRSSTVTTLDLTLIRRLILGIANDYSSGSVWRFVPSDFEFGDPHEPWNFTSQRSISVNQDWQGLDFIGVKLGDVNGSWIPSFSESFGFRGSAD